MFHLRRFLRPYLKETIIGFTAKLLEAMLELLLPFYMAKIIDYGIAEMDISYIWKMGLIMLGIVICGLLSASLCQYYASKASQGVGNNIRRELMEKISEFSYKELDEFGNATLINRVTNDVNQVILAVAFFIRLVSRAPFLCIGALIMSIYVAPQLSLIFAVLIPLFILVLAIIMKLTVPMYKKAQSKLDHVGQVLKENLNGVRVIRAFARHKNEKDKMDGATDELAKAYVRVSNLSALMNPLTTVIMNAGIIITLYLGAFYVDSGDLTKGTIVALISYITQVLLALIIAANLLVLFTKGSASASRISEILECGVTINDPEAEGLASNNQAVVEFDNVSFGYTSKEAISNISFKLTSSKTLGIVGTTGSGKTSLVNLIPRFYDTCEGKVKFNALPVDSYKQVSLREKIGIVPQKAVLFTGSIADNVRWGNPDADEEEVIEALKIAQAYDFVMDMADGINSYVFEGGQNFSGGQRQRLTIARALVKKPELLIMDDSLSALDYKTDLSLRRAIKESLKKTTVIIVSQRISSVAGADSILVLDDGIQVGYGTHGELLETCETYREIYESQK